MIRQSVDMWELKTRLLSKLTYMGAFTLSHLDLIERCLYDINDELINQQEDKYMMKSPFPRQKANKIGKVRQVAVKPVRAPKIKQTRVVSGKMRKPKVSKMNVGY